MRAGVDVRAGEPVLVQTGAGAGALAELLHRIAGPGIPAVLEHDQDRVVTTWAAPLLRPHDPGDLAVVAAAIVRAHDAGVVHGPFEADHLRCGPLLAGWGAPPADWRAADDVASFGALLADAGLVALAGRARSASPARPTMAALAAALLPALTPLTPAVTHRHPGRDRRLLLVVPVLALLIAAAVLVHAPSTGATDDAAAPPTSSTTTTTSLTTRVIAGGVISHDGRRWSLGEPDDLIVLGDWFCDGRDLPAVLRPATGQVWRFDAWPAADAPAAGRAVGTVKDAATLEIRRRSGCDELLAVQPSGQRTSLG